MARSLTVNVNEAPFSTALTSLPSLLTVIVGLLPQDSVSAAGVGTGLLCGIPDACAGTMTRLRIIVNASSDERNFFIIFFILSCCFDLGSARTEPFSYMAFYHAAGNKGTGKCKIHKFFIFPSTRLPLVSLIRRRKRRFCFTKSQIFQNFLCREKPHIHEHPRHDLTE